MQTQIQPVVTILPPDPSVLKARERRAKALRVAAYCRVSTDQEEQQSSYESQISFYTELIENHAGWTMAGVFADDGISGTQAKRRPDFIRLMELCKRGKVDLILTKSISRFARNTVECISYVRDLKEMGINIIFEKEGIDTSDMTSELMLSFLSAFAQAESESISANVTWGKRRSFADGKVTYQYARFYGYEKGSDNQPKVVPEQARVVRRIFHSYLAGYSLKQMKSELEAEGVPSSTGKPVWSIHTLQYMLRNEKYIGDAILQKTYVADFMTKKIKKNNGEIPKYYVTGCHEAIVDRDIWNRVQEEIARRAGKRKVSQKQTRTAHSKYSGKYALSELLVCGDCGAHYRRVTWARNGTKRIVWRCISRLEYGTRRCKDSPTIQEEALHNAIVEAFNRFAEDKDEVLVTLREGLQLAVNGAQSNKNGMDTRERIKSLQADIMTLVQKSMKDGSELHDAKFRAISAEISALQDQLAAQEQAHCNQENSQSRLDDLIAALEGSTLRLKEYDDTLTRRLVEQVRVLADGKVLVKFSLGPEYKCIVG